MIHPARLCIETRAQRRETALIQGHQLGRPGDIQIDMVQEHRHAGQRLGSGATRRYVREPPRDVVAGLQGLRLQAGLVERQGGESRGGEIHIAHLHPCRVAHGRGVLSKPIGIDDAAHTSAGRVTDGGTHLHFAGGGERLQASGRSSSLDTRHRDRAAQHLGIGRTLQGDAAAGTVDIAAAGDGVIVHTQAGGKAAAVNRLDEQGQGRGVGP